MKSEDYEHVTEKDQPHDAETLDAATEEQMEESRKMAENMEQDVGESDNDDDVEMHEELNDDEVCVLFIKSSMVVTQVSSIKLH